MSKARSSNDVDRRAFLKGSAAGALGLGLAGGLARDVLADEEAAAPKMQMRVFGRTKREVSVIGVGCGGIRPDKVGLLNAAVRNGVNFIDTAWSYQQGQSEMAVGAMLAGGVDREKLFINTKASGFKATQGTDKAIYEAFKVALQKSLARMKTEYVDCLMWPHGASTPAAVRNEAMQNAFRKLKEEGLVRSFGTSSHSNYKATMEACVEDGFYDVLLAVINICTQNPDEAKIGEQPQAQPGRGGRRRGGGRGIEDTRTFLAEAKKKDIAVMAMKVAKQGFLGNGTDALLAKTFPGETALTRHQKLYTYGLQQEGVHVVIPGMTAVQHVREAIAVGQA